MFSRHCVSGNWLLLALIFTPWAYAADPPLTTNALPDGTAEATARIAGMKVPEGMRLELFAAEPQLYSPVALCLDEQGRVFVAEEFRFNRGTEENRTRPFFLEDDLQIRTLADRLAMYHKHADKFEGGMEWFRKYTDQVRLLEDRDGDGKAERSNIFAGDFNDTLDGLAAGVIARDGDVYLTNIPHLWRLRDENGDGVAEKREKLLSGFGVNAGFLGHDLHGPVWGPDGRLYFSVGDRGFHVETKEGATLALPRRGAVFRCQPDGTQLEVVHIGLRNPQELAFDEYGNLFADDNNCDKGDYARLVYIVPGGDSGWNMAYQTIPAPYETGPWHAEHIWHLAEPESAAIRPAYSLPPVGKLGAGPSGFAYCGAAGWSDKMRGRFYMCNYTGNGGIESFAVQPKGAAFELVDQQDVLKPISATDCDFGYDGKMYVSDFVGLEWNGGSRGGRIYTLSDTKLVGTDAVQEVKRLFQTGFRNRENDELAALLKHADMRVRQRAQFVLAERGAPAIGVFVSATQQSDHLLSRLHGIWGLGQLAAKHPEAVEHLLPLLTDQNATVRLTVARTLGDIGVASAAENLLPLLHDENLQVRFWAATALGQIKHPAAVASLFSLLQENADQDLYLRHAAVCALDQIGNHHRESRQTILSHLDNADAAVRLGVLLVLRRRQSPDVARLLLDPDVAIATEAARAVNDLHLDQQTAKLAALADSLLLATEPLPEALSRRILNANFRLGRQENALKIVKIAIHPTSSPDIRREAISCLADWAAPPSRDRVTGFWRPLEPRDPALLREWLEPLMPELLASTTGELQTAVTDLVAKYGIKTDEALFVQWVKEEQREASSRIAALRLLTSRKHVESLSLLTFALQDKDSTFRAQVVPIFAATAPEKALPLLASLLHEGRIEGTKNGSILERQAAAQALAAMKSPAADDVLAGALDHFFSDQYPAELQLDLLEGAEARAEQVPAIATALATIKSQLQSRQPFAERSVALRGGSAERGRAIFAGHRQAQCVRCHKIATQGGEAGPDLTRVASRDLTAVGSKPDDAGQDDHLRAYLLESLLSPSNRIAPGFGTITFALTDGTTAAGIIKSERSGVLELLTPDNKPLQLKADEIEQRSDPKSAMPAIDKVLTLRELRDLIEYLATLK